MRRDVQARPADGARERRCWRIRRWDLFEPDGVIREGYERTPPSYVREWINDDRRNKRRITRGEIELRRRAILRAGGAKLYGIFRLLVCFAADRPERRGCLLDHRGRPAGPEIIAEMMGAEVNEIGWGLRLLSGPQLRLIERIDLPGRSDGDRPAGGDSEAPEPSGEEETIEHGGAEDPESDGEPRARGSPEGDGLETRPGEANRKGNAQRQSESETGDPCGSRKDQEQREKANGAGSGAGETGRPQASTERSGAPAEGRRDAENESGQRGPADRDDRGPADGSAARPSATTGTGETDGNGSLGSPASTDAREGESGPGALARAGEAPGPADEPSAATGTGEQVGDAETARPARPISSDGVKVEELDGDLWGELAEQGISWAEIRADRRGLRFGMAVYLALGYPLETDPRFRKSEIRCFANRWAALASLELGEGVVLTLVQKGLRKALCLRDQRAIERTVDGKGMNVSAVWCADWTRRCEKMIAAIAGEKKRAGGGAGSGSEKMDQDRS